MYIYIIIGGKTMHFLFYIFLVGLLICDVLQREESKNWIYAAIFFPIVIIIYIFVRKPKPEYEDSKLREGFNMSNIIMSVIILIIVLAMYYSLFISPIHTGQEYDSISQSYLIGATVFFFMLIIGIIRRDFAIVGTGMIGTLIAVIICMLLPLDEYFEINRSISVSYQDGIFEFQTDENLYKYSISDIVNEEDIRYIALKGKDEIKFNEETLRYYRNNEFRPFSGYAVSISEDSELIFYERYVNGRIKDSYEITDNGYIDIDYGYVGFGSDTERYYPEIEKKIIYENLSGQESYEISSYNTSEELKYWLKMDADNNLIDGYIENHFYSDIKEYEVLPLNGVLNAKVREHDTSSHGLRKPYSVVITDGILNIYHDNGVLESSKTYENGDLQGYYVYNKNSNIIGYKDVLDIKGRYSDFVGYLEIREIGTINSIETDVYINDSNYWYGTYFDYVSYAERIELKKYGDKKTKDGVSIFKQGIHFYIDTDTFEYDIYDIDGHMPEQRIVEYNDKLFNEYYYNNSNLSFKYILNKNDDAIKEAYIDYVDISFAIEFKNGRYIIEASNFDGIYKFENERYIIDLKED